MTHFVKALKVCEAICDNEGAANAKANIAYARSKYESDRNDEELLKASHESYELRVAKYGKGSEFAIDAGKIYAVHLHNANRRGEARDLLTKLLITSKQVLGPQHNTTKRVKSELERL